MIFFILDYKVVISAVNLDPIFGFLILILFALIRFYERESFLKRYYFISANGVRIPWCPKGRDGTPFSAKYTEFSCPATLVKFHIKQILFTSQVLYIIPPNFKFLILILHTKVEGTSSRYPWG